MKVLTFNFYDIRTLLLRISYFYSLPKVEVEVALANIIRDDLDICITVNYIPLAEMGGDLYRFNFDNEGDALVFQLRYL